MQFNAMKGLHLIFFVNFSSMCYCRAHKNKNLLTN